MNFPCKLPFILAFLCNFLCNKVNSDKLNKQTTSKELLKRKFPDFNEKMNEVVDIDVTTTTESVGTDGPSFDGGDILWTEPADEFIKLTDTGLYNKYEAPGQTLGETTFVELGFYIESLSSFRVMTMDFEVDLYLLTSWKDVRLSHHFEHPILINDLIIAERFWTPDLFFVNSKLAYKHKVTSDNFLIYIYNDGQVLTSTRVSAILSCLLDLRKFPMDEQECSMVLQSYAFVGQVVNLTWHFGNGYPIMINENVIISDMDIVKISTSTCESQFTLTRGSGHWSCAKASIRMKRKLNFHIFQLYMPTAMLVTISWFSFWLDIKAAPARVGLTITALLTLTTISSGNRQDFPHVPYMKANDLWVTVCQLFVVGVLLQYTFINLVMSRSRSDKCAVHSKKKKISLASEQDPLLLGSMKRNCKFCEKHVMLTAHKIDKYSRLLFPISFGLFGSLYFVYFLYIF